MQHKISLQHKKGFTLVEIMVALAVIAFLVAIALVAFNNSRIKSRTVKRKADIAQLRKALETYFQENQVYPTAGTTPNNEVDIQQLRNELVPRFMDSIPNDPKSSVKNYQYVYLSTGGQPKEYGLLVPFSNDGGQDCKWITSGGRVNWFRVGPVSVPDCTYQQ